MTLRCAKLLLFHVVVLCIVVTIYSDDLVKVGNSVVTYDTVGTYNHLYGDNITALVGSTICLDIWPVPRYTEPYSYYYFNGVLLKFVQVSFYSPFIPLEAEGYEQIKKYIVNPLVCVLGDPGTTYSGLYRLYRREEHGEKESDVTSNIQFITVVGTQPNFEESEANIVSPQFSGILGNTFIIAEFGSREVTITITATDIEGYPKGTINWSFTGETGVIQGISSDAHYSISSTVAGVSVLVINDFVESDLGTYTATAINSFGSDTGSALAIMGAQPVFPTPTPPLVTLSSISNSSTNEIGASFNVDVLGKEFSIDAIDLVSFPRGTITWHYSLIPDTDNQPLLQITGAFEITDQTPASNSGSGSNLRFVNGIADASALGYYTANSTNMFGTARATSIVGRPPLLRTSDSGDIGSDFGATIGGSLTITTRDTQGFPVGTISWSRIVNGAAIRILTDGKYTVGTDGNFAFLTITGITRDDLGTYRATATNVFGENSAESEVGSVPRIDFVSGSQVVAHSGGEYKVGMNIILKSLVRAFTLTANDIDGVPTGNITWNILLYTLKGNKLKFNVDRRIVGTYGVTATNKYGTDQRNFNIRAAPQLDTGSGFVEIINATSATKINIKIGTSANTQTGPTVRLLAVDIFGIPTGTITWRKDSVDLSLTTNVLTIRNIGASDYGTYTATATNEWGTSSATSVISKMKVAPKFMESNLVVSGTGNIGDAFNATIGSQFTIVARGIQGIPASTITWTRRVDSITRTITYSTPGYNIVNTVENGFSVSTLTTTSSTATFGIYTATASNSEGQDKASSEVGLPPLISEEIRNVDVPERASIQVNIGGKVSVPSTSTLIIRGTDVQGSPIRTFIWYINGVEQTQSSGRITISPNPLVDTAETSSTIKITRPTSDLYGNYTLVAINKLGRSQQATLVGIRPVITKMSSLNVTTDSGVIGSSFRVATGGQVIITTCVTTGFPDPTVQFTKIEQDQVDTLPTTQTSTNPACYETRLTDFQPACYRIINAKASNSFGSDYVYSRTSSQVPSIVRQTTACVTPRGGDLALQAVGSIICAINGRRLDISCELKNFEIATTDITWFFQGQPITSDGTKHLITEEDEGSRLSVLNVSNETAGIYQCRAEYCREEIADKVNSVVDVYTITYQCLNNIPVCRFLRNNMEEGYLPESECQREELQPPSGCGAGNRWCTGEWTSCSDTTCQRGRRTRSVFCCENGNLAARLEDPDCSINKMPPRIERCGSVQSCASNFSWHAGSLSECSTTCGPGTQTRVVTCHRDSDHRLFDPSKCITSEKPEVVLKCEIRPCDCNGDMLDFCEQLVAYVQNCNIYDIGKYCCSTCASRNL